MNSKPYTRGLGLQLPANANGFRVQVGYCPHPVTVYIRGPTKGYIYNHITTIQLLLSTEGLGFRVVDVYESSGLLMLNPKP